MYRTALYKSKIDSEAEVECVDGNAVIQHGNQPNRFNI
jgi:hypothetical protein